MMSIIECAHVAVLIINYDADIELMAELRFERGFKFEVDGEAFKLNSIELGVVQ
jgi:hypothetical protein